MSDRDSAVNTVRVIQAVEVTSIFGAGTTEDPILEVTEYFLPDGRRIGRKDSNGQHHMLSATLEAMKPPNWPAAWRRPRMKIPVD